MRNRPDYIVLGHRYTEGTELIDSALNVVRKEADGFDSLQGAILFRVSAVSGRHR